MKLIDKMTGLEFEHCVAGLLKNQGYTNVRLTEKYDYGVDIIATKNDATWGIQVKRYSGLVKANAVRQVVTALKKYKCDRPMVITNSIYSNVAKDLAECNNCVLVDRVILDKWLGCLDR
jgi:restriction system protein